jgi:hypothetical protein
MKSRKRKVLDLCIGVFMMKILKLMSREILSKEQTRQVEVAFMVSIIKDAESVERVQREKVERVAREDVNNLYISVI